MLTNCLAACTHLSSTVSQIFEPQVQKSPFSRTQPRFLFPLETPLRLSRNMLHGWKVNSMLAKLLQHVPIYLQQFPNYMMFKSMRNSKNRYFYHILVSPGDAPGAITLNVVWMKREFDAYKSSRSMYPSILNSFPVIRTAVQKVAVFTYRSPDFCFPWRRPCDCHAICCTDGKTIQCLPNLLQHVPFYLQQFPSYTMLKSMRKSKNRYFFTTFLFPLGMPLGQSC